MKYVGRMPCDSAMFRAVGIINSLVDLLYTNALSGLWSSIPILIYSGDSSMTARKWHAAGLLSDAGLRAVEAR